MALLLQNECNPIVLHNDLFIKIVSTAPYEDTFEQAAQREASFQTRSKSIVDGLKTPFRVSVPTVHGIVKNVLVTEKVKGVTFEKLIRRDIDKARTLIPSLDLAVKEKVEQGIYHNDLYQDNVMWDEENQTIWIVDFGMANSTDEWNSKCLMSEFVF